MNSYKNRGRFLAVFFIMFTMLLTGCGSTTEESHADDTDAVLAYIDEVEKTGQRLADNFGLFSDYFDRVARDTTLLYDIEWLESVGYILSNLEDNLHDFRSMDVPEQAKDLHAPILDAADEYELFIVKMDEALATMNLELLEEANIHMRNGTSYISDASTLVSDYVAEYE